MQLRSVYAGGGPKWKQGSGLPTPDPYPHWTPAPSTQKARDGLKAAKGESSHRPFPATPPRNHQGTASSRTSRDPAPSLPDRLPAPFFTELGTQRGTEESGRKTRSRSTPGSVVQPLQAAIFFRSGGGREASKDYKSQLPLRFVFVQKKKNPHSPSSLFPLTHADTHIHTHTPTADTHGSKRRRESCVLSSRLTTSPVSVSQQRGKAEARPVTSDPVVMRSRRIP